MPSPYSLTLGAVTDPGVLTRRIVAELVESPTLPRGAGYGALTDDVVEYAARVGGGAVEFIEVGPISVVLNGVSPLDGADSYAAPGFSGPGGAAGPP